MSSITTKTLKDGRPYTVRDNRDRFFYPNEWLKFRKEIREINSLTFDFLISTGARINEARNVLVEDIDLDNKRIIIRVTKVKAVKKEKKPRPRPIPISSELSRKLRKYIKEKKLRGNDYLGIASTQAANQLMKRALERAKIKDWQMFSIHNIRKSFEMWLLALGIDSLLVTSHVGHSLVTAATSYVSAQTISGDERRIIRDIIGDLYEQYERRW